jgi:hypothetical protein
MSRPALQQYVIAALLAFMASSMIIAFTAPLPDEPWPLAVLAIAAAVAAAMIAGWSYGVHIDATAREVRRWRGPRIGPIAFPLFERVVAIPTDAHVTLRETFRSTGKNGGYHIHVVEIDEPSVLVTESRKPDVARLRAEQIAKVFGLDVIDHTAHDNPDRTRALAELDLPLAAQLRLRGVTTERRPLPAGSMLTLVSETMPWLVRVAPRGLRARDVSLMIFIAPFIFGVSFVPTAIVSIIAANKIPMLPMAILIAVAGNWFGVWRRVLRTRRETQHVQLSPSGIRVVRRAPGTHSAAELSAERIEEIVITPNRERGADGLCVVARGDGVSLAFGHELDLADAAWLRDTAIAALAPQSVYR